MATKKNYLGKPNYRFLDNNLMVNSDTMYEFDESSLWNSNHHHQITSTEFKKSIPSSRIMAKKSNRRDDNRTEETKSSVIVSVTSDWAPQENTVEEEEVGSLEVTDEVGIGGEGEVWRIQRLGCV
ncbi:hypothetical protein MKW94_030781 [Papaver nudicaule]|uniref:Uncharacterized protein n=1 Tax=Papaver nudicaule TaxID=74823 RepID=A0AA41UX18_PAPNU|nr:hypothetical protein [Papaver nudicaule]